MSNNMNNRSNSGTLFTSNIEDINDAMDWELRPGGMFVKERDDDDDAARPMIKFKVSLGSYQREFFIPAQATFVDLKKLLSQETGLEPHEHRVLFREKENENDECLHTVGMKYMEKVILMEDPNNKESKLEEMKRNQSITKSCEAISTIKAEVDSILVQVSAIEEAVNGGTMVANNRFIVVIDMLMIQLLKLDNIKAEEEAKVQIKIEVQRVHNYVEPMNDLKRLFLSLGVHPS